MRGLAVAEIVYCRKRMMGKGTRRVIKMSRNIKNSFILWEIFEGLR